VLGAGQGGRGILGTVDGQKIADLTTESTKLWCFAFGPTNDVLIGGRSEARVFDCEGALRCTIPVPDGGEAFTAACFGPAGERLLLGDDIGRVHVHRVGDGHRVVTFARAECSVETHYNAVLQLRLHSSGERFISTDYCGSICLRELESGRVLARQGEQPAPADAILLTGTADQLCYADRHGHVRIWDFGKNELSKFGEDWRWYTGLAATPDGQYLAGSGYLAQVEVYRRDGKMQAVIPHDAGVWDCEFSPDGTLLATCTDAGIVRIFDLGGVLLRELRGHRASINQMRWSPDGRSILTASQDGDLQIWQLDRDELPILSGHRSEVLAVFPLRGGGFVSGDSCGMLRIWSDEGKLEKSIDTSPSRLEALAYTRHSDAFFASLTPGVIASWTATGEFQAPVLRVQDQTLGAFALADGRLLVVLIGTNDESAVFEYYPKTDDEGWVTAGDRVVCASELGRAVCSSFLGDTLTILHQGEFITQWDVSGSGAVELGRYPIEGHKARIVAATGEGRSLFLCGEDSVLRLFEPGRGIVQDFVGHERAVTSVVLSPDGKRIVSTSRDGTVRVWDRHGAELVMLRSENGTAHSAVFSEDGRRILVGYSGCVARFWYHQIGDVQALATRLLGRLELDPEERSRYGAILDG
jgi:WD40 repeat protein